MTKYDRFIRQTSLSTFGSKGQSSLAKGRVLIVGMGGLGLPVAQYLNAMGVGTLGLVEQDVVEFHNLQRQVLYTEADVGKPKVEVALQKLKAQNSETQFLTYDSFLVKENAKSIIEGFDIVVDATDNFATRYLINDVCVILNKPFVYGALHAFEGQVSVFNYNDGPTYRCLFPNPPSQDEIPNCDENGVLGVLPGIVGTFQALEVVKMLTGVGEVLSGKLLLFDGLTQSSQKIKFPTNPKNKNITQLQESYDFQGCLNVVSIPASDFIVLHEQNKVQVIDVRSREEFALHHLNNASNIPLNELESQLHQINFGRPVYLLCQSGKRSKLAFEHLYQTNPNAELFNIEGGLNQIAFHAGTT